MPKRARVKSDNDEDEELSMPKITRKGHNYLHTLALEATGCLAGISLIGTRPRTQNARLIVNRDVKPFKNTHDAIKALGQWDKFVELVFQKPGFNTFENIEMVSNWLNENASLKGNISSIGDEGKDCQGLITIQNLGIEPSQFLLLPIDFDFSQSYRYDELEAMIPRPDTTKKHKKHTLFLHPSGFSIFSPADEMQCSPEHLSFDKTFFYDIDLDLYLKTKPFPKKKVILVADNLCVFYQCGKTKDIQMLPDFNILGEPNNILNCLTAGEMRSVLQKIIRFNPKEIIFEYQNNMTTTCDALQVLRAVILKAVIHPGGFVPNLQCHERGLPSMLKRLAVTSVEDSFVSPELIHRLLIQSAVAFKDENYYPCCSSLTRLLQDVDTLYHSTNAVIYDSQRGATFAKITKYDAQQNALMRSSFLLDQLKAFSWDLDMFRDLVYNKPLTFASSMVSNRPKLMNFEWFLDHHVKPHIAYYVDIEMADYVSNQLTNCRDEVFGDFKAQPYAKFFKLFFQKGTGFNYRRSSSMTVAQFEMENFTKWLKKAQRLFWQITQKRLPTATIVTTNMHEVKYTIDPLYLSSCIGQHKFTVNGKQYLAFISQVQPIVCFDVVREPSRGQKSVEINKKDTQIVILEFRKKLMEGIFVSNSLFGKKKIISFNEKTNHLTLDGEENPKKIFQITTNVSFDNKALLGLFEQVPTKYLQRLWQLTNAHSHKLIFPKITRNGGPDDEPVNYLDIYVFQLCLQLKDIMILTGEREFTFINFLGWSKIRDDILKPLVMVTHNKHIGETKWNFYDDLQERELKKEQQQAFDCFCNRHMNGERANIYIAPCGTGKTLTVLTYIKYLNDIGDLPNYIFWIGPKDSLQGTFVEIQQFTKQVVILNGCKTLKKKKGQMILQKDDCLPLFHIIIIDMDHLKMLSDQMNDILPQCFVVVDEFQVALCKKTQRTSNVRRLTAISYSFLAFSGTPVLNSNVYEITPLLAQIVPIEVKANNFFIAYSACVNQGCISTRLKIIDIIQDIPMPFDRKDYWSLLPLTLGGNNKERLQGKDLMTLLSQSQSVCDPEMIRLTFEYITKGHVVFLVANNLSHAQHLNDLLKPFKKDVYLIADSSETINLTHLTITGRDPIIRIYDVIIAPIRICKGYNLSISDVMISSVYCSNSATRIQIRGRINRLSSQFDSLTYVTVHCGISKLIEKKQDVHDSFAKILDDLNMNFK